MTSMTPMDNKWVKKPCWVLLLPECLKSGGDHKEVAQWQLGFPKKKRLKKLDVMPFHNNPLCSAKSMFCPFFVNGTAIDNVCKGGVLLGEEVLQTKTRCTHCSSRSTH